MVISAPVRARRHGAHPVAPAQVDVGKLAGALDQPGLDVILLQVDEGRALVAGLGQQVELGRRGVSRKILPTFHTTPLATMRSPTPSRSATSSARLEKQMAREPSAIRSESSSTTTGMPRWARVDGRRQPDRPGAHDDHRMMHRRGCILVRRAA
jgi:hypothetical protein